MAVACDVFIDVSVLSFFPRDVLDEIWDLIGSVSEGFPTYFFIFCVFKVLQCRFEIKFEYQLLLHL